MGGAPVPLVQEEEIAMWPPRIVLALGFVAAVGAAFVWHGERRWQAGYEAHRVETVEAVRDLNERLRQATKRAREAEADLSAVRIQLDRQETERENEARNDPDADGPGLGAGSLQRLDTIR